MADILNAPVERRPLARPTHAPQAGAKQVLQPAPAAAPAPPAAPRQVGGIMDPPPPPPTLEQAEGPAVVGGVMPTVASAAAAPAAPVRPTRPELQSPPPAPPTDPVEGAFVGLWVQFTVEDGRGVPGVLVREHKTDRALWDLAILPSHAMTLVPRSGIRFDPDGGPRTWRFAPPPAPEVIERANAKARAKAAAKAEAEAAQKKAVEEAKARAEEAARVAEDAAQKAAEAAQAVPNARPALAVTMEDFGVPESPPAKAAARPKAKAAPAPTPAP